jgi:hypothetical protein
MAVILVLAPIAIEPTVPPTVICFVMVIAVPTTLARIDEFWVVEVPAVKVEFASPIGVVELVVEMTGLIDSPVPVELISSNRTGAPPTGLLTLSLTVAVSVAVLRVAPTLGGRTATLDCRVIEFALELGEVMESIKLAE